MKNLLQNKLNLNLLELIVSGSGVEINVSELSKNLKRHRNTIKERVNGLIEHNIISKPQYPLLWIYKELPLMVISRHNFNRDEITKKFIESDQHIFAAFFFKEEEYNTLMISFHKDVCSHQKWYEKIIREEILPHREIGYLSQVLHLGTGCFEKYNPSSNIKVIKKDINDKRVKEINGYKIDKLSFDILKNLMRGYGIRTNENYLAKVLHIHRRTVERRIKSLYKKDIIGKPICRFPRLIVPPNYILVKSLFQIKKNHDKLISRLKSDPHITWMINATTGQGGYNLVIFSSFYKIEDHLKWQEQLDQEFPSCIGSIKDTYLSPAMTFSIDPEYVSLCLIKNNLAEIKEKN